MTLTLLQKIENLTWWNEINKLKDILKSLVGTTPTYKVYTALLTQESTNPPTAIVQDNTTGQTVTWSYSDIGEYIGTFSGNIEEEKLWFSPISVTRGRTFSTIAYNTENTVVINTYDGVASILSQQNQQSLPTNGRLSNASVEIRIYN